jgi:hypothetical protein
MNREDVIRWMQEVGAKENNPTPQTYEGFVDIFQQFAALVAAHEREACCKIVHGQCESDNVAQRTVDAIRARGEVPR